jgi:hypothetical protein
LECLAFIDGFQASFFQSADMHEHVRPAIILRQEAIALAVVEPFHRTG